MTRNILHAGLVFGTGSTPDASRVAGFAARALHEQGCQTEICTRQLPGTAMLTSPSMRLRIRLQLHGDGTRVVLTMDPLAPETATGRAPDLALLILLYGLAETFGPDQVEWLDPAARIDTATFLSLFDGVTPPVATRPRPRSSPARPLRTGRPAPIATPRQSPPCAARNDIRRLNAWAITGCVATLSLPVAASMAAVNLLKGEDFRLNTQVLSMTLLVVSLPSYGLF